MDVFKHAVNQAGRVQLGGWKCPCCSPPPKLRQKARRGGRRILKQQDTKELRGEK